MVDIDTLKTDKAMTICGQEDNIDKAQTLFFMRKWLSRH